MSNVNAQFGSIVPGRFVFVRMEVKTGKTVCCEGCGYPRVKYIHVLREVLTGKEYRVGCDCAGAMLCNVAEARKRQNRTATQLGKRNAVKQDVPREPVPKASITVYIESVNVYL
jgi:hypothetical protein